MDAGHAPRSVGARIGAGIVATAGVLWLLLSMLVAGALLSLTGAGRASSWTGQGIWCGAVVWVSGFLLIATFIVAVVKRLPGTGVATVFTSIVALGLAMSPQTEAADFWGSAPTVGSGLTATVIIALVTIASIGVAFLEARRNS